MAVINIRGWVVKYMYIPTGIKSKRVNCRIISGGMVTIYASGKTISSFAHIEGITLGDTLDCWKIRCYEFGWDR
jgi:hypothetical protein